MNVKLLEKLMTVLDFCNSFLFVFEIYKQLMLLISRKLYLLDAFSTLKIGVYLFYNFFGGN